MLKIHFIQCITFSWDKSNLGLLICVLALMSLFWIRFVKTLHQGHFQALTRLQEMGEDSRQAAQGSTLWCKWSEFHSEWDEFEVQHIPHLSPRLFCYLDNIWNWNWVRNLWEKVSALLQTEKITFDSHVNSKTSWFCLNWCTVLKDSF